MDYYYFCQQCKDYFETARVKVHKCMPFIAPFFCGKINFCWQQQKLGVEQERANFITQEQFEVFVKKSLEDSTLFMDNILNKIKKDSQYQQEEVQDWAFHLKYPQFILM